MSKNYNIHVCIAKVKFDGLESNRTEPKHLSYQYVCIPYHFFSFFGYGILLLHMSLASISSDLRGRRKRYHRHEAELKMRCTDGEASWPSAVTLIVIKAEVDNSSDLWNGRIFFHSSDLEMGIPHPLHRPRRRTNQKKTRAFLAVKD